MNNAAAITAVNRTLVHYRCRQAHAPTDQSAREIAQISMFAEYLHDTHTADTEGVTAAPAPAHAFHPTAAAA